MKITIIGSGSKGNSTLIETENTAVLIDAGLPLSNIEKRLNRKLPRLDIIIITHTHTDHVKGLQSILKKQTPLIYTIENDLTEKVSITTNISYDKEITIENLTISLFELSHDVPCLGVSIKTKDKEMVYITDTGYIKDKLLKKYQNKDIYILESNYDEEMIKNGSYPFYLKQRIRSDKGHLSNKDTCRYLKTLIGDKTKYLCLAHLSEENNTPDIVKEEVSHTIKNIDNNLENIIICSQYEIEEINI